MNKIFTFKNHQVSYDKKSVSFKADIPAIATLFTMEYNKNKADVNLMDADGRDRKRGVAEMMYIYFMYDSASEINNLNEEDRHIKALEYSHLPKNYKISKELKEAIEVYKENISITAKTVNSLNNTLHTSITMLDTLNTLLSTEVKEANIDTIESVIGSIEKVVKLGSTLPTLIKKMQELELQLRQEQSTGAMAIGGHEPSAWEMEGRI